MCDALIPVILSCGNRVLTMMTGYWGNDDLPVQPGGKLYQWRCGKTLHQNRVQEALMPHPRLTSRIEQIPIDGGAHLGSPAEIAGAKAKM
jgi:hypothetical protein